MNIPARLQRWCAGLVLSTAAAATPAQPMTFADENHLHDMARLVGLSGPFEITPPIGRDSWRPYVNASGAGSFRVVPGGLEVQLDRFELDWGQPCQNGACTGPLRAVLLVAGRRDTSTDIEADAVLGFALLPLAPDASPVVLPARASGLRVFVPLPAKLKLFRTSLMVKVSSFTFNRRDDGEWSGGYWAGEGGRRDLYWALHRAGLAPDPCANQAALYRSLAGCKPD